MSVQFLLALSIAAGLLAQQGQGQESPRSPDELLDLAKSKVASFLERLPRFMCTVTVARDRYDPTGYHKNACDEPRANLHSHLVTSDRLRLDVTTGAKGEIYSWVGEQRFSDRDLLELVEDGAIANGSYGIFLKAVFTTDQPTITYQGTRSEDGRQLAEYAFKIPQEKSHYTFGVQHKIFFGWGGTFSVDARTGDLLKLVVQTDRLPPETGVCDVNTTIEYVHVRMNETDFIFPKDSHLHGLNINGSEADNRTVFSACHEFHGESTVSFDSAPEEVKPVASVTSAPPPPAFKNMLKFRVALTDGLDTTTAAVGDPVNGKLVTPIADGDNILVPAGAVVHGRITRIQFFFGRTSVLSFAFKLETVEIGGVAVRLPAAPYITQSFKQGDTGVMHKSVFLGPLLSLQDRSALFRYPNAHPPFLIRQGLESEWVTWNGPQHR